MIVNFACDSLVVFGASITESRPSGRAYEKLPPGTRPIGSKLPIPKDDQCYVRDPDNTGWILVQIAWLSSGGDAYTSAFSPSGQKVWQLMPPGTMNRGTYYNQPYYVDSDAYGGSDGFIRITRTPIPMKPGSEISKTLPDPGIDLVSPPGPAVTTPRSAPEQILNPYMSDPGIDLVSPGRGTAARSPTPAVTGAPAAVPSPGGVADGKNWFVKKTIVPFVPNAVVVAAGAIGTMLLWKRVLL